eukprot:scaffold79330_cov16-Tisochrysis_lutea.AAC.2
MCASEHVTPECDWHECVQEDSKCALMHVTFWPQQPMFVVHVDSMLILGLQMATCSQEDLPQQQRQQHLCKNPVNPVQKTSNNKTGLCYKRNGTMPTNAMHKQQARAAGLPS